MSRHLFNYELAIKTIIYFIISPGCRSCCELCYAQPATIAQSKPPRGY